MKNTLSVTTKQAVIWGDMDAFQHVNNIQYFRYFENVRIEYFEQAQINQFMSESKIGPILGTTSCKYLAPLTYPDNISITTRVTEIREKRFTMEYLVFSEKLNQCVAEGSAEIIYFDYRSNKTSVIPAKIVENINRIENAFN